MGSEMSPKTHSLRHTHVGIYNVLFSPAPYVPAKKNMRVAKSKDKNKMTACVEDRRETHAVPAHQKDDDAGLVALAYFLM